MGKHSVGNRHRDDSGSVLMLMPAVFLIVLVLGSIAIDAGVVFLHQRDLAAAAAAAANDATTLGLDVDQLRDQGNVGLDPDLVVAAVNDSLTRRGVLDELVAPPRITVSVDQVEITLVSHAEYIIAPSILGERAGRDVTVTVRSQLVIDD